jgi:hypothetical protein
MSDSTLSYFVPFGAKLCDPLWFNVFNFATKVTKVNRKDRNGFF